MPRRQPERGSAAGRPHLLSSPTKWFTPIAVRLAIADGLLSLDDRVAATDGSAPAPPAATVDRHPVPLPPGLLGVTPGFPARAAAPDADGGERTSRSSWGRCSSSAPPERARRVGVGNHAFGRWFPGTAAPVGTGCRPVRADGGRSSRKRRPWPGGEQVPTGHGSLGAGTGRPQ
ncbi:hypothetical protein CRI70_19765 [Streptomyces sp. Ru87]|nr:hypothetical protein CRI70_19765 [Streptomyces sp. Ru87]